MPKYHKKTASFLANDNCYNLLTINLILFFARDTFRKWVNSLEEGKLKNNVRLGRPRRTTQEVIELIIRMARENLDWGYGRIMAELKKLNIKRGRNTIKRIMIDHGLDPAPKRYEDSWDA